MNIGIATPYSKHEATYAACHLAEQLEQRSHAVRLFSTSPEPYRVSPLWDRRVTHWKAQAFSAWIGGVDTLCLNYLPRHEQMAGLVALRAQNRSNTPWLAVLVDWHDLTPEAHIPLRYADRVVVGHGMLAEILARRWNIFSAVLPFDPGLPFASKPDGYKPDAPKILFPIYDGAGRKCDGTAFSILEGVLSDFPDASLTVMYTSSTIASFARRRLSSLKQRYRHRVTLGPRVLPSARPAVFAAHDITFCPYLADGRCIVGLYSVYSGTPLVCFAVPPYQEVFTPENSVQVPTRLLWNDCGAPIADPDYPALDRALRALLSDRERLAGLQQSVLQPLSQRRILFHRRLTSAFNLEEPA